MIEADFEEYEQKVKDGYIPLRVICELDMGGMRQDEVCNVDSDGWGGCGDSIMFDGNALCPWIYEVQQWQKRPVKGEIIG